MMCNCWSCCCPCRARWAGPWPQPWAPWPYPGHGYWYGSGSVTAHRQPFTVTMQGSPQAPSFAGMASDPDYLAESERIEREFAQADAEAWKLAEAE